MGLRVDDKGWIEGSFLKELYNSYIVECVDQTREYFTYWCRLLNRILILERIENFNYTITA